MKTDITVAKPVRRSPAAVFPIFDVYLPQRQFEVYNFIRNHIMEFGYPPTIREIGRAVGGVSNNGVMCHLIPLREKGVISVRLDRARSITLLKEGIVLVPTEHLDTVREFARALADGRSIAARTAKD